MVCTLDIPGLVPITDTETKPEHRGDKNQHHIQLVRLGDVQCSA